MKYFSLILSIVNIGVMTIFWYRFAAPVLDASSSFAPTEGALAILLAAQANHHSLLQIYLILVSILIAFLAYWGYNGIKRGAEEKAEKVARLLVPGLVRKCFNKLGPEDLAQKFVQEQMAISPGADSKEVFTDNIKNMQEDPHELPPIR